MTGYFLPISYIKLYSDSEIVFKNSNQYCNFIGNEI